MGQSLMIPAQLPTSKHNSVLRMEEPRQVSHSFLTAGREVGPTLPLLRLGYGLPLDEDTEGQSGQALLQPGNPSPCCLQVFLGKTQDPRRGTPAPESYNQEEI